MKKLIALMTTSLVLAAFVCAPSFAADDNDKPKHSIKDIMKKAFKGPLVKKVAGGNASDAEKKELHELLEALAKNTPKKGEEDNWKKLTGVLVKAGKAAVDGEADAGAMLKKAANCKACHKDHK